VESCCGGRPCTNSEPIAHAAKPPRFCESLVSRRKHSRNMFHGWTQVQGRCGLVRRVHLHFLSLLLRSVVSLLVWSSFCGLSLIFINPLGQTLSRCRMYQSFYVRLFSHLGVEAREPPFRPPSVPSVHRPPNSSFYERWGELIHQPRNINLHYTFCSFVPGRQHKTVESLTGTQRKPLLENSGLGLSFDFLFVER
jgi:hypothetical protein